MNPRVKQDAIGAYLKLIVVLRRFRPTAQKDLDYLFVKDWVVALRVGTPNIAVEAIEADIQGARVTAHSSNGLLLRHAAPIG